MHIQIDNGDICINDLTISILNVVINEQIGEGASGLVFMGTNNYLERKVVVKIWLKRRSKDQKNKLMQGIAEVRKTDRAIWKIIQIYDAGVISEIFYAVMEYFPREIL